MPNVESVVLVLAAFVASTMAAVTGTGGGVMHITKMGTYGAAGAFTHHAAIAGLLLSPIMIAGSYVGKRIVDRIPEWVFVAVVEIVLVVFGVFFLITN